MAVKKDSLWILAGLIGFYLYQQYQTNKSLNWSQISGESDDSPSIADRLLENFQPDLTPMDTTIAKRRSAFLQVLQDSEGTSQYENPYGIIFGGKEMDGFNFADHPGNLGFTDWAHFTANGKDNYSTASGAYQFTLATWNRLKSKLGLPDFTPQSQDLAALELIREKGALNDIDTGDIASAVQKVASVWASLPGAPYGQPTHDMAFITNAYNTALSA